MEKQRLQSEDARPHFFKIIYGEDVKQHLRIPRDFMKHLPQEMPNRATLTGVSGTHWRVSVSKDVNSSYFQKGWKEFMKGNNLRGNEFLTFRYDGNMLFYVKIFDPSGVKREPPPVFDNNNGKPDPGRPKKRPVGSLNLPELQLHGPEEGAGQSSGIGKTAEPFASPSPHFMAGMIKSNVRRPFLLRIPLSFSAAAHFPPSKRKVVLRDSAGKAWDVICLYDKQGYSLSGGWRYFARYHNLKLGDVCKFELVSVDEMKVHVL